PAVMHTRHANVQRTDPRDDRSRLSVAVAHHLSPTGGIDAGGVLIDPRRDLGLDRLHEHPPGALAENVGKRIPRRGGGGWQRERVSGNVFHGGVLLPNVGSWGCEIHPRYAAFFIRSSTGFGYSSDDVGEALFLLAVERALLQALVFGDGAFGVLFAQVIER